MINPGDTLYNPVTGESMTFAELVRVASPAEGPGKTFR